VTAKTLGGEKRLLCRGHDPGGVQVTESTVTSKGVIVVNYERFSVSKRMG
jgi:hypothetical protein